MSTSEHEDLISQLLHPEVQRFIQTHESTDVHTLSLRYDSVNGIPFARIAEQIAGRQKARSKLPQYFAADNILYPPAINLEQCSSEWTALFKTQILLNYDLRAYRRCADLTGGFGVDSLYLSSIFSSVDFVEPDAHLLGLARHNHGCLGSHNLTYHNTDAEDFLGRTDMGFDLVYLDPSRRPEKTGRVIDLTSYTPDVDRVMTLVLPRSPHILLKASPMLDIQRGIALLSFVKKVIVVAVSNEVRELLFFCDRLFFDEPPLQAVNLKKDGITEFSFYRSEEQATGVQYEDPQQYLYEPDAAILKAGGFKTVARRFGLTKLHRNTHLYTSNAIIADFPGRIFKVEALARKMSSGLEKYFPDKKGNVLVRNYPLSADELKTKSGLRDGGVNYLLGFTSKKGGMLAAARRIR